MHTTLAVRDHRRLLRAFVVPFLLFVAWVWASRSDKPSFYFVSPAQFWSALREIIATRELPTAMMASVSKAVAALALGGLIGTFLGVMLAVKASFEKVFGPSLHGFRQVPLLGLSPLIGLWFGNGAAAQSALGLLASTFPTMLNAFAGVRSIDIRLLEVAKVCGMSRKATLRRLVLPAILPFVIIGLSQATAFAWLATIGSEMVFSAGLGVGTMMQTAQAAGRMDVVLVCVATVSLVGMSVNYSITGVGKRFTRWRDVAESSA